MANNAITLYWAIFDKAILPLTPSIKLFPFIITKIEKIKNIIFVTEKVKTKFKIGKSISGRFEGRK